jgi:magnesium-transporting ATPase (P-type)
MDENIQTLVTLTTEQAFAKLDSSEKGLTSIEAKRRQTLYGSNEIVKKTYRSVILEAISHSTNPLVAILLFAAVVSAFTGSIDILCSDKTGTLTSGEMILEKYIDISGKKSEYVLLLAYLNSLFGTEFINRFNIAVLKKTDINPLDAAILKHDHPDVQSYAKVDIIGSNHTITNLFVWETSRR